MTPWLPDIPPRPGDSGRTVYPTSFFTYSVSLLVNNGNEMLYISRACPDFDGTETCGQAEPRLDQEVALLELKSS